MSDKPVTEKPRPFNPDDPIGPDGPFAPIDPLTEVCPTCKGTGYVPRIPDLVEKPGPAE